ncbi:hypothetical protein HOY82DRAFT_555305 [Tuber indicum]|nr:hypothetical protein HOY82DRAFT_555305 [Tuber indicum]
MQLVSFFFFSCRLAWPTGMPLLAWGGWPSVIIRWCEFVHFKARLHEGGKLAVGFHNTLLVFRALMLFSPSFFSQTAPFCSARPFKTNRHRSFSHPSSYPSIFLLIVC